MKRWCFKGRLEIITEGAWSRCGLEAFDPLSWKGTEHTQPITGLSVLFEEGVFICSCLFMCSSIFIFMMIIFYLMADWGCLHKDWSLSHGFQSQNAMPVQECTALGSEKYGDQSKLPEADRYNPSGKCDDLRVPPRSLNPSGSNCSFCCCLSLLLLPKVICMFLNLLARAVIIAILSVFSIWHSLWLY